MKRPRFFCENCGVEVPLAAKVCPNCKRPFSSVRCPVCNFSGEEGFFDKGCPVCGYLAPPANIPHRVPLPPPPPRFAISALPLWVYVLTIVSLLGLGAIILLRLAG